MASTKRARSLAGLSIRTVFFTTFGILLFGIYFGILLNGENSLTVLNQLTDKKKQLIQDNKVLKKKNQELQKEFFELKQLDSNM